MTSNSNFDTFNVVLWALTSNNINYDFVDILSIFKTTPLFLFHSLAVDAKCSSSQWRCRIMKPSNRIHPTST